MAIVKSDTLCPSLETFGGRVEVRVLTEVFVHLLPTVESTQSLLGRFVFFLSKSVGRELVPQKGTVRLGESSRRCG